MSDHTYIKCEDCRNHGKCRREKSIPSYYVKGCMVEVKREKENAEKKEGAEK